MTPALDKAGGPFECDDTPRESPQSGDPSLSNTFFNEFDSVLVEALPQLVWVADAAGSTIYVNQRWYGYTGLTPEEALGPHGWTRALHPDDRERAAGAFADALAQDAPYEQAYRIVAADG
jgi:PAS domain S-box-containing protein